MLNIFRKAKNGTAALKASWNYFLFILIMLSAVTGSVMISSCDKMDNHPYLPYVEPPEPTGDTIRKVLLEDYTGHKCPNCPEAAYFIYNFQHKLYKKQVIAVAIHPTGSGGLTSPGGAPYTSDYRTTLGDNYATTFKIPTSLPMGTVNRKKKANGEYAFKAGQWD